MGIGEESMASDPTDQVWENPSHKGQDSKYFGLCGPYVVPIPTTQLCCYMMRRVVETHKGVTWLCSIKTLFRDVEI